ncbi:MAG: hypothetical protein HY094_08230 [Candidatus Melainabacteria bacterium]|nr:hypothetical protein [Candidatus Melainabacteria bacterium]
MIINEIKNIKSSKKELREFEFTLSLAFAVLAGLLFWRGKSCYYYFFVLSILLLSSGLLFPVLLKPIQKIWMTIALILGFVMTRVILFILFYLILSPVALISRLLGKQFLDSKVDKNRNSYWNYRSLSPFVKEDYEKQF